MSNLLKGFNTKQTDERIIDYNDVISNKIDSFRSKLKSQKVEADGFVGGLNAAVVESLIAEEGMQEAENEVLPASEETKEEESSVSAEDLKNLAEDILSDANARADEILENARKEAEKIKKDAYDAAYAEADKKGYEHGCARAEAEYQTIISNANDEQAKWEEEYKKRYDSMESELVEILLEIFSKVTNTIAEDNKEIVLFLINRVMNDVEATGDFLIRVSKADYPFLAVNQGKIYCASPKDINISVLEDSSLKKSQCIIETDGGIFDCSLDIQLEQLTKDIKLLSCLSD